MFGMRWGMEVRGVVRVEGVVFGKDGMMVDMEVKEMGGNGMVLNRGGIYGWYDREVG
ncbi:hypothetical protein [Paenibacillus sp. Y412MC10]|uniref:hypothetical protein n=1 Tax=Geobacillus sp. (strain Y412MC10) TaxID=481743 RepID=UPI001642C356|nr:hypothetical protein [Paenibacillus sp. Y412MC10]